MNKKLSILGLLGIILPLMSCEKSTTIKFDYVFTAQPVVASTNSEIFENVQTTFNQKSEGKRITQASIFVKNSADRNQVNAFLKDVKSTIETGTTTPTLIKSGIEAVGSAEAQKAKFGVPGAMAMKVTNASNGFSLDFEFGEDIKDEINGFLKVTNPNQFKQDVSDDVFYSEYVDTAESYSSLKILAPTGAPAVALYSQATNPNFETTDNPKEGLIPQFSTGNYDIIVAPTNGGLVQITKQNAQYKLAATITFGMFYIVSSDRDADGIINEGDKICVFQENDVPGLVFKYLYGDLGLNVHYVSDASQTKLVIEHNFSIKL